MGLTFQQGKTSGTTTAQFSSNCTVGSYLLACVFFTQTSGSATVSDPTNGSWTSISGPTVLVDSLQFFHVPVNASNTTLTVTFAVPGGTHGIIILEYTGQAAVPFDAIATLATGSGTTATSNSVTTTFTNETLVCFGLGTASGFSPGAGWNSRQVLTGTFMCAEDQPQAAIGPYTATWTQTSGVWVTTVLGIKSSASTSTTPDTIGNSICRPAIIFGRAPNGVLSAVTTDGNGNIDLSGQTPSTVDTVSNGVPLAVMIYGRAPNGQMQAVTTDGDGQLS